MINYNLVKFTMSAGTAEQLPNNDRPEIAFVGRSNVGKSSLMNKLFGRKDLVKVSSKPGKTTTINFFAIGGVDFVDLPGYGYARVNATEKQRWDNLMDGYFEGERNLKLVVALVDIRHDASPLDAQMIGYLESLGHPTPSHSRRPTNSATPGAWRRQGFCASSCAWTRASAACSSRH